jgi:VanZ family protein
MDVLGLVTYCALIYWLSDQPSLPMANLFPYQDKVQHFLAYMPLGLLSWRAFGHWIRSASWRLVVSTLFCLIYGFSDEWHQSFVPGRTPDLGDWVTDGLATVTTIGMLFARRPERQVALQSR